MLCLGIEPKLSLSCWGNRVVVNPLRVKNWIICELEASLVLFFTGVSRASAKIIADQSANVEAGTDLALSAMHAIKREACTMKESLLKGDFSDWLSPCERDGQARSVQPKVCPIRISMRSMKRLSRQGHWPARCPGLVGEGS